MRRGRPRGRARARVRARPQAGRGIDDYFRLPPVLAQTVTAQPARPALPPPTLPRPLTGRFIQQRIERYISETESEAGHSGIISLYYVRALENVLTYIFFQKSVVKAQPHQRLIV
jgi:hypothetical protein